MLFRSGCVLLEAVKTAYCPGFQRLTSCAKSGRIGKIVSVDATVTESAFEDLCENKVNRKSGGLAELAAYPLLAVFKLLGYGFEDIHFTS